MSSASWTNIEKCRGCHAGSLDEVLSFEPMPLAGQFCRSPEEASAAATYPLTWLRCSHCGLVQVQEDVDDRHLFSAYNYSSSTVGGLVRHFAEYASHLARAHGPDPIRFLEIGCNDGVLLSRLPTAWHRIGVDPSDVARERASGGYDLVNEPFSSTLAAALRDHGPVDVISGSNCLAHISDLKDVFQGVSQLLRDGGTFYVEVHDLDATLEGAQWDTIYHEHKVEWSVRSLARCLSDCGLAFVGVDHLPLHGGLLRARFQKSVAASRPAFGPADDALEIERHALLRRAYRGRRDTATYRLLSDVLSSGRASAYGASGRANVWLNQLPELKFDYIVDDSPLRNNRWLPVVGTKVVPSSHFLADPTNACLITAWNYAADIRAKHPEFQGTWAQTFGDDAQ